MQILVGQPVNAFTLWQPENMRMTSGAAIVSIAANAVGI